MNHLREFGRNLDANVKRQDPLFAFLNPQATVSAVKRTGVYFDINDYDFATHELSGQDLIDRMDRNGTIIASIVMTMRPDLAHAICPKGKDLYDVVELYVRVLDRESRKMVEAGAVRSEVYHQGAEIVIRYFDGGLN
jgi:hypothetical protein